MNYFSTKIRDEIVHDSDIVSNSIFIINVYVGGYCGLSEIDLCFFVKLCPVGFLVVCKCSYVLLQFIAMSYVECGDDGRWSVRIELSSMSSSIVC